jgi:hypothetical protein
VVLVHSCGPPCPHHLVSVTSKTCAFYSILELEAVELEALQDIEFSLLAYRLCQRWVELCSSPFFFFWTIGWMLSPGLFSRFKVTAQVDCHGRWIPMSLPGDSWKPKSGGLVVPLPQVIVCQSTGVVLLYLLCLPKFSTGIYCLGEGSNLKVPLMLVGCSDSYLPSQLLVNDKHKDCGPGWSGH